MDFALNGSTVRSHPCSPLRFRYEEEVIVHGIDRVRKPAGHSGRNAIQTTGNSIDVVPPQATGTVGGEIEQPIRGQIGIALIVSCVHNAFQANRFGVGSTADRHAEQIPTTRTLLSQRTEDQHSVTIMEGHATGAHFLVRLGLEGRRHSHQPQPRHIRIVIPERGIRCGWHPLNDLQCYGFGRVPNDRRTSCCPSFGLRLEAGLLACCCEVCRVKVSGPFEVVLQLGQPCLMVWQIHIRTPLAQCDAEVATYQRQTPGLGQGTSRQPAVQTSFFWKQTDKTLVILQCTQPIPTLVSRLSPGAHLLLLRVPLTRNHTLEPQEKQSKQHLSASQPDPESNRCDPAWIHDGKLTTVKRVARRSRAVFQQE